MPDSLSRKKASSSQLSHNARRETLGGFLSDRDWMNRVLEQTRINLNRLVEWGYPFSQNDNGHPYLPSLHQGAEYMRLMRKQVKKAGVQILDHSPALELLIDMDGVVAGAKGICRQTGKRWTVRAGAVILATGGCAFLSKALGCSDNSIFAKVLRTANTQVK